MSMKRPEPFGGVDGRRCGVCFAGANRGNGNGADAGRIEIALFAFGGRPRGLLGEPVALIIAGTDAGGLVML